MLGRKLRGGVGRNPLIPLVAALEKVSTVKLEKGRSPALLISILKMNGVFVEQTQLQNGTFLNLFQRCQSIFSRHPLTDPTGAADII